MCWLIEEVQEEKTNQTMLLAIVHMKQEFHVLACRAVKIQNYEG